METNKMSELYKEIAENINEIIPTEWHKVWLYSEVLNDSSEVAFYFCTDKEKYFYGHNIPDDFQVSERVYVNILIRMQELFIQLREEFIKHNEQVWTTATLELEHTGKLSIEFGYDDVLNSGLNGSQRKAIWAYENLGIYPKRKSVREFLEEYIKNKEENN
ncbi:antitoxin YezG family protein [Bacillus safensis]|uniref:antitoxin YezG family protein n=1 Tax=Bacillus safensis TaxID=561879 RepID=UPI00203EFEEB|nr:antitoxin YezG family protein [Bacillus safensis]MCM2985037.1 antitoxin YezG family protein [Bacillus safensis]MCY7447247.1 antitoxin YezG family protein [Bacillus safensis]MCY7459645.1 antitoxin YezG family protein [Bacillus safensis]MCY7508214.1 antitoxin YezG family protein [Bacillus safensis]MCY7515149.1 antitoxin YezG family protein [Bacillus safensis]